MKRAKCLSGKGMGAPMACLTTSGRLVNSTSALCISDAATAACTACDAMSCAQAPQHFTTRDLRPPAM